MGAVLFTVISILPPDIGDGAPTNPNTPPPPTAPTLTPSLQFHADYHHVFYCQLQMNLYPFESLDNHDCYCKSAVILIDTYLCISIELLVNGGDVSSITYTDTGIGVDSSTSTMNIGMLNAQQQRRRCTMICFDMIRFSNCWIHQSAV